MRCGMPRLASHEASQRSQGSEQGERVRYQFHSSRVQLTSPRGHLCIQLAKDHYVMAKTHQAIQANRQRRPEFNYRVGDLVYLNTGNLHLRIKQQGLSAKFFSRFVGLFSILEARPETLSYKLDLSTMYQIHPVFHAKLFKLAMPNDPERFPMREPPPPGPVFENSDGNGDNYEVEYICDHRDMAHRRKYYIHWKGWSSSDDEWIHEDDMESPDLIAKYLSSILT